MTNKTHVLRCQITAVLVAEHCRPARLDMRYDPGEGCALTVRIHTAFDDSVPVPADWRLSRDLVYDGLTAAAGMGDVRVRPLSEEWTMLELRSGGGPAVLIVCTADLRVFLAQTLSLVPLGEEGWAVDWDDALRSLEG